jgi:cytoskeleton protein RodZ
MGLSVADVAAQIRLAPRQIEALEADDIGQLPELPFVRGFVRSYAKLLHLDAEPLLATLPNPHAVSERIEPLSVGVPFNIKQLSKQQNQIWLVASAVVAVIVLVFAWWQYSAPTTAKVEMAEKTNVLELAVVLPEQVVAESSVAAANEPATDVPVYGGQSTVSAAPVVMPVLKFAPTLVQSAVPAVIPAVTPPVTPAASATTKLHIVFDGESWSEIKDASGRILSSRVHAPGSELNLNDNAPYELVIGHARSVRVYRRGKLVDLTSHTNSTSEVARLTLE